MLLLVSNDKNADNPAPAAPEVSNELDSLEPLISEKTQLDDHGADLYEKYRQVIKDAADKFIHVAEAIWRINDQNLYRPKFETFEDCMATEFGIARSTAYHYMDAYKVIQDLSSTEDIQPPTRDAQVRPLVPLDAEGRIKVWMTVSENAKDGTITGPMVEAEVERYKNERNMRPGSVPTKRLKAALKQAISESGGAPIGRRLLCDVLARRKSAEADEDPPPADTAKGRLEAGSLPGASTQSAPSASDHSDLWLKEVTIKLTSLMDVIEQGRAELLKLLQERSEVASTLVPTQDQQSITL